MTSRAAVENRSLYISSPLRSRRARVHAAVQRLVPLPSLPPLALHVPLPVLALDELLRREPLALETVAHRDGDTQQFTDHCTATDPDEWALQDELARVAMRALRARLTASGPAPTRPVTRRSDDALRIVARADIRHDAQMKR